MKIFKDKADNLWLGTFGKGLNIHSPISSKFFHELADQDTEMSAFAQTTDGTIWFSSAQAGLNYITNNSNTGDNIAEQFSPLPIAINHVSQLFANEQNELWLICADNQLFHLASL